MLTADGHDLGTTVPEFCVGERVDFKARLEPPVDAAVLQPSSGVAQWVLPGKFVNEAWQRERWVGVWPGVYLAPYGSVNYRVNPALLRRWDTSCWYVNKPGGPVRFGAGLQFKNGQYATLIARGDLHIYRPDPVVLIDLPPAVPQVVNKTNGETSIKFGNIYDDQGMEFKIQFTSRFAGKSDIRQLVKRQYKSGIDTGGTYGHYWLDANLFYITRTWNPDATKPVTANRIRILAFSDNPEIQCKHFLGWTRTQIEDTFLYYVMFRPDRRDPSENIYVSLGKGSWSWKAHKDWVNGAWTPAQDTNATRPSIPDSSDDLPEWPEVYVGVD